MLGGLFPLLNRAARYFPILRELRKYVGPSDTILEVGSGAYGIGEFWSRTFVGCDVMFDVPPRKPMLPVISSGFGLPFKDDSFNAVIASDVMEHIVPDDRNKVISEILRVTRDVAVFGYPCGPEALAIDHKLRADYQNRGRPVPAWLEEHMLYPFPDANLFSDLPSGWKASVISNESLRFHYWMMRSEMHRPVDHLFRLGLLVMPGLIQSLLLRADKEPAYRKIFIVSRS